MLKSQKFQSSRVKIMKKKNRNKNRNGNRNSRRNKWQIKSKIIYHFRIQEHKTAEREKYRIFICVEN